MNGGALSKVLAIAGTNLRRFMRDRSNYFFVFLFPLGLILIFGLSFGGGFEAAIGVSAGSGELSQRFVESLSARPGVSVVRVDDVEELRERVERGGLVAGVVVPEGLDARLAAGEDAELIYLANTGAAGAQYQVAVMTAMSEVSERVRAASYLARRTPGSLPGELPGELTGALARVDAAAAASPAVSVTREFVGESLFGDDIQSFDLGAGSQLVLFVFITGLSSSASLIQSRQLGVSRRMLGSPTSPVTIVTGEALGRYAVALFQGVYIILATWLVFGVDWGSPLAAVALLVVFSAVAAAAAMLVGSVFSNDQQASGVSVMLGLGLAALGGAMAPLEIFGPTMRNVARFVPHSWAVEGYATLLRHGGGLADVVPELGVLLAFAVALFALAAWRFRATLLRG